MYTVVVDAARAGRKIKMDQRKKGLDDPERPCGYGVRASAFIYTDPPGAALFKTAARGRPPTSRADTFLFYFYIF